MASKALDYTKISNDLFIGKTPKLKEYEQLKALGVGLIINMRAEKYAFSFIKRRPIKTIWVPTFDRAYTPIRARQIVRPTHAALTTIKEGQKVYVYCYAGRHRSVLMGTAILIAQGHTVKSATQLIASKRLVADPEATHIYKVIEKFAETWPNK